MIKKVDYAKLAELRKNGIQSPRHRTNFNLHEQLDDPIQRLCITGEADTVFPPHRHPGKWELMILLKGSFTVYIYNDDGSIQEECLLAQDGSHSLAVELPVGCWHNCVFHESGTTFLEVKKGPYQPLGPEDKAPFAGKGPTLRNHE